MTTGLRRCLGAFDCSMLVVGGIIGVGIFITPATVAARVPDPRWALLAWGVGGAIALAGALAFAELATSFPEAGGPYVYLREAFGPFLAFIYGWMATLLVGPGATAVLALGGANHLGLPSPGLWAAAAVVILGAISAFGVRAGAAVQSGLNGAKLLAMGGLLVAGFLWGDGSWGNLVTAAPPPSGGVTFGGFALALIPITFTYSGWNAPMFVGGEIADPARTIPRAVLFGTLTVVGVYLAMNVLYLYALPAESLGAEKAVARAAAGALLGPRAAEAVGWLVGLSVFGCMANGIVTGPRVPYAMAKDGLLPGWLAEVHPRWQTPVAAIALQTALAVVALSWAKTIDRLLDLVTVPGMVLTALAVVGLFRLRKMRPDLPRPYTAWGSPWVPVFFVGATGWIVVQGVATGLREVIYGLALMAAGAPAYVLWRGQGGVR